ncbi:uncharacterized protein OCT59_003298 [Rhizophagus irregularis]|uniref:uncharacterized protein n=1 Tax=Rhizophagus irregularis TaxID=588596 RepID=UPI00332158C6|nr:hypothetical protein OCT59_003298 [Rhizophagus irregularis]
MPMNDYRLLKNSCIKTFNERYKEFDEDIYLLAFFLHPQYKGAGIHNIQFERIQKTALNIWKNLGHKKTSGLELKAQLHKTRTLVTGLLGTWKNRSLDTGLPETWKNRSLVTGLLGTWKNRSLFTGLLGT